MKRGDIVQPTENFLAYMGGRTKFTRSSRLVVRVSMRNRYCRCGEWILAGEHYAASGEVSSSLHLSHVEVVRP